MTAILKKEKGVIIAQQTTTEFQIGSCNLKQTEKLEFSVACGAGSVTDC